MATILIVDDHPTDREFLVTLLGYQGHRLLEAADGAEGLAIAQNERPDLIIADILMPTMDGYEFIHQLRTDPALAQTAVIFYTAHYLEREGQALAQACGVSHILVKPAEPEEVLRTVQAGLGLTPDPAGSPDTPVEAEGALAETFDREHLRLVTDKLFQKAGELSGVNQRLTALIELGRQLVLERDPRQILERFCRAARDIIGARYAAIGILDENEQGLRYFFTSGLDAETTAQLGSLPAGQGLPGRLLQEKGPLRLSNPATARLNVGLDRPDFPALRSFLGVPIASSAQLYGWLYLADKLGPAEFSPEDEQIIITLAAQVSVAYENWQQYDNLQQRTVQLEQEITERERVEVALHEQGELLQVTLASIGDAVIATDIHGGITFMNPMAEALTGWPQVEAKDKFLTEVFDIINEETRQAAENPIIRSLREGVVVGLANHTVLIRKDRAEIPIDDSSAPIRDELGNLRGAVLVFRDITERKRAEEALRLSRDQLTVILGGVADGITAQDITGRLIYANDAAARLTGYPSAQALLAAPGSDVLQKFEVLDELGQPFPLTRLPGRLALQGEVNPSATICFRLTATGEERWSYVKARPIFNEQGQVELAVNIFQDITELKRSEQSQRFLAEAGQMLAASLDYETTLAQVAQLAVPQMADWCAVDIVQADGTIHRLAVAHIDPAKVALAHELQRRYPPDWNAPVGVPNVLRTGQAEIYPEITEAMLEASARDAEQFQLARELSLRSAIIVPLTTRGRTFGVMTFVWAESGRRYGPADLALAEELARRAALAVDNAQLYREAQRLNAELEQRVLRRTTQLQAANQKLEAEIAERKQVEAQLRQAKEFSENLINSSFDGILAFDQNCHYIVWNSAMERLSGLSRAETLGKNAFEIFPFLREIGEDQYFLAALAGNTSIVEDRPYRISATGRQGFYAGHYSPIRDMTGQVVGGLAVIRDITLRKEMQAELDEIQHRLVEGREKDRLRLAREIHDSPVQDLYGVSFGLEAFKDALDEPNLTQFRAIQATLQQVISTLRSISGELRPQTLTPFGLEKAIVSYADRFQEAHPELKVELKLTPDGQTLPEEVRLALFRIYQEMINNAAHHAAAQQVWVRFTLAAGQISLEIEDDGHGFEIPQRWIRLARQGHLGLIEAAERAEAIGGQLEVISRPGAGTLIRVVVPR